MEILTLKMQIFASILNPVSLLNIPLKSRLLKIGRQTLLLAMRSCIAVIIIEVKKIGSI